VLVVEDEEADRVLIQQAFQQCSKGSSIVKAVSDGAEAIAYLMGEGQYADRLNYPYPSYIITDLKMPRMDGFDVLEHLKANPSWQIIPAVVFTSSEDPDDIRTSYALGASSYVIKPSAFADLCSLIHALHTYWMLCSIPDVDDAGQQVRTLNQGKLGERYPQCPSNAQNRVRPRT
jgi:CheY-like chemotaxis protein